LVGLRRRSADAYAVLIRRSAFGERFRLERETLLGVPIYLRITLFND
jgi:hypothetical protein